MVKRPILSETSVLAVAARLRLTREASGMKQAAWSRRVGITAQAWNNYERGVNRISLDEAIKVCKAIGATLDWIYRGERAGLPVSLYNDLQRREKELKESA